jgi:hypothetical protein
MAGLFDVDKEVARLGKQRAKLEKELAGVAGRLDNGKFLERASEAEVAKVGAAAAQAEAGSGGAAGLLLGCCTGAAQVLHRRCCTGAAAAAWQAGAVYLRC